jgi:hypothetical protein
LGIDRNGKRFGENYGPCLIDLYDFGDAPDYDKKQNASDFDPIGKRKKSLKQRNVQSLLKKGKSLRG